MDSLDGDLGLRLTYSPDSDSDSRNASFDLPHFDPSSSSSSEAPPRPPQLGVQLEYTMPGIATTALHDAPPQPQLQTHPRPTAGHSRTDTLTRRMSFPLAELDPSTLHRIKRTLVTFALVEFDIDSGPNLDNTYPPTRFPRSIQQNIAFSSLPEGADLPLPGSGQEEGYAYSWRIPYPSEEELVRADADAAARAGEEGKDRRVERLPLASEQEEEGGGGSLYGYVWFVREQDSRLRRGYAQRSLVLITHLPSLSGLFSSLMQILGPLHFKHAQQRAGNGGTGGTGGGAGGGMVETACRNIASWPALLPGSPALELPFLGSVLTISLPLPNHQVQLPPSSSFLGGRTQNLPYTHPPSPFLSREAWEASDRLGTAKGAGVGERRRARGNGNGDGADAAAGGGGGGLGLAMMGEVSEGVIAASLPLTPLCVLLFTPSSSTTSSSSSTANGSQQQHLSPNPSSSSSPHLLRKSPSLSLSSSSSPSTAASSSTATATGALDFSTLVVLWELLVLGEPLLVWSGEPRVGSEVVEGLKALIRPIPFAGDDRPYLHVHDADFARLCKPGEKPQQGLLIASTNPLLLTTCKHWPHILRLDRFVAPTPSAAPSPTTPSSAANSHSRSASRSPSVPVPASPAAAGSFFLRTATAGTAPQRSASTGSRFAESRAAKGINNGTGDAQQQQASINKSFGLKTNRRRHVKKDEAIRKEIEALWQRGEYSACDAAIYRYFASLTEQFLAPLNRYFGTLWAGNEVVARTTPLMSPGPRPAPSTRFSSSAFLASLRTHGSSLSFRSSAPSLSQPGTSPLDRFYLKFIDHSPHFQQWLQERINMTGGEVRKRYVRQLESVDVEDWAREKQLREVEELVGTFEKEVGRLEAPAFDFSASPSPLRMTPRLSLDTASSSSPNPSSRSGTGTGTSPIRAESPTTTNGPAAKLRAQASRLRLIRDEKVRSLSLERDRAGRTPEVSRGTGPRSAESV
ncbi:hypothetical protein JCM10908_006273 [Rhodotorula pacifica]|uniref:uncharacterized protein n=1 Tax=Rhodotorula pacifica TaxID=1495444 RepID=UPI00316F4E88